MNYIVRYENFNESKCISDSCEKITGKIAEIQLKKLNNNG